MVGYRLIFIILSFSAVLQSMHNKPLLTYENGMDAYRKGQYDLAIQEFESILSNNWESSSQQMDSGDYGTPGTENFSSCEPYGDINSDGITNVLDVVLLVGIILNELIGIKMPISNVNPLIDSTNR